MFAPQAESSGLLCSQKGRVFFLTFMNLNSMSGETEHTEHPGTAMGGESGPEGGTEAGCGEWTIPELYPTTHLDIAVLWRFIHQLIMREKCLSLLSFGCLGGVGPLMGSSFISLPQTRVDFVSVETPFVPLLPL